MRKTEANGKKKLYDFVPLKGSYLGSDLIGAKIDQEEKYYKIKRKHIEECDYRMSTE